MKTVFLSEARWDIDDGRDFYDECEFGVGEHFVNTIYDEAARIWRTAGSHRTEFGFFVYRSKIFPYGIYYRVAGDSIQIAAVLDLRRDPAWIHRELEYRNRKPT